MALTTSALTLILVTFFWIGAQCVQCQECSTSDLDAYGGYWYVFYHGYDGVYRTFNETRAHCQSLGGDMVIITSQEQNNFISERLLREEGYYYIGLEHVGSMEASRWIDGTILGYNNWVDTSTESLTIDQGPPYCGVMRSNVNDQIHGKWNRVTCTSKRRHICQIPVDVICRWHELGESQYLIMGEPMASVDTARATCQSYGGDLAMIKTADVNTFLKNLLPPCSSCEAYFCYWFGLHRSSGPEDFSWLDETALEYADWYNVTEPNNPYSVDSWGCLGLRSGSSWYDQPANHSFPFICERTRVFDEGTEALFGGMRYFISASWVDRSYSEARTYCQYHGADLALITSEDISTFLNDMNSRSPTCINIGLTDQAMEGTFTWIDGTPLRYSHWRSGEPNNDWGNEDCVCLLSDSGMKWNDHPCPSKLPFICERQQYTPEHEWTLLNGTLYYISQSSMTSYSFARRFCQDQGGDLAQPKTQEINTHLIELAESNSFWFGLDDLNQEGTFQWIDGTALDKNEFLDWSNGDATLWENESCVHQQANTGWRKRPCTSYLRFACEKPPKSLPYARCLNATITIDFGRVQLPVAELGVRFNSNKTCPIEYSEAPDTPIIRAICQMSSNGTTYWNTSIQCDDSLTRKMENILQDEISESNRDEVAQELFILTQNSDDIGPLDITLSYEILQLIADLNSTDVNVTDLIVGIVNNIMYVDEGVLASAQENGISTTLNIVQILESQLNTVNIGNSTLEASYPNIAVQVRDVPQDGATDGIVLTMFSMDTVDLSNSYFRVGTHQDTVFDSVLRNTFARVVVPGEVLSVFTAQNVMEGPSSSINISNRNILGTTVAPGVKSGSRNTMNPSTMNIRIAFVVYVNDAMFPSESLTRLNLNRQSEGVIRQVNTPVVSLTVGGQKIETLMKRVNITFFRFENDSRDPTCNFWEFSLGKWSMEGCQLLPEVNSVDNLYYTCACDHLTNFAVLVDIYAADEPPKPALRLLSIIGCTISCVCLFIAILSYLSVRKVRESHTHRIFICLCFTLLCLYIASLAIIALDRKYQYAELEWIPCTVLAALLHYCVLSSLTWMGIEGFNTYLVIIRVFNTHIRHYMIKASIVGWGIPAVIVGITGGITRSTYAIKDYCYIKQWPLIGGLLIPGAFILIVNIIVFIMAMIRLEHSARLAGRVKKDHSAQRQDTRERIQNGIATLVLLGITWTTGYLTLINVDFADILFIVSNSFQGFFIFVLYCLRKATIREQWRRCLCGALFREGGSAGSQGTSGQTPGSRPSNGTGDSRPISAP